MVNYYDILKVSQDSSAVEVKSAYRRLARKLHPDTNNGSKDTALKFAAIAEAYEVLGNSRDRGRYDELLLNLSTSGTSGELFGGTNRHVKRWRQMVYEKRYNDIIDRMLAEERLENMAFQRAIFPLVSLLVTSILCTALKPMIFISTGNFGKIIIISLFAIGIIHIIGRVKDGFVKFTDEDIHESILDGDERAPRQYSRILVAGAIVGSIIVCLGIGYVIGTQVNFTAMLVPSMFSREFEPEFFLYPPIVTFFVDAIHSIVSRFER